MPTYEYLCDACGFKFEEFQSIAAEPLHVCPRCGGTVHRLISGGGGVIFKGSGFYETDYKHKTWKEPDSDEKRPSPAVKSPKEGKKSLSGGD